MPWPPVVLILSDLTHNAATAVPCGTTAGNVRPAGCRSCLGHASLWCLKQNAGLRNQRSTHQRCHTLANLADARFAICRPVGDAVAGLVDRSQHLRTPNHRTVSRCLHKVIGLLHEHHLAGLKEEPHLPERCTALDTPASFGKLLCEVHH